MPRKETLYGAQVGLSLLAAAEVPNFLAGMLPSLMTIGRFAAEPEDRAKLRRGEVVGSLLSLTVGGAASLVANNPWPFVATVAVLIVLLYEYEKAIRDAQENGAQRIDQQ